MDENKMFINGNSMTAENIVLTEFCDNNAISSKSKLASLVDRNYFQLVVTKAEFDSHYKPDDFDKDLVHKFTSGELVTFESTKNNNHYIFQCGFLECKKSKKCKFSFTAIVSGPITVTGK
jgi:hypothetical protein